MSPRDGCRKLAPARQGLAQAVVIGGIVAALAGRPAAAQAPPPAPTAGWSLALPAPHQPNSPFAGTIQLEVVQLGFDHVGDSQAAPFCVRNGFLAPLILKLSNAGSEPFAGRIEYSIQDPDADRWTVHDDLVALTPRQRDRVFVLPYLANLGENIEANTRIYLRDSAGRLVTSAVVSPRKDVAVVAADDRLVLTLGLQVLPGLYGLETGDDGGLKTVAGRPDRLAFARLAPALLPTRADLLRGVDTIVWNNPRPSELSAEQVQALAEWVRGGGWLLLCLSTDFGAVVHSPLGALLPAPIERVTALPLPPTSRAGQPSAVPVCTFGAPADQAEVALRIPHDIRALAAAGTPLALRRPIGRGSVVVLGCDWADLGVLLGPAGAPRAGTNRVDLRRPNYHAILRPLLGQRYPDVITDRQKSGFFAAEDVAATPPLRSRINATVTQTSYLLLGSLFLTGYVLVVTFGVTAYLKHRQAVAHSWTAFGLAGAACATLSLLGVRLIKGEGLQAYQVNFVDAAAGQTAAQAVSLFGLRTGDDRLLQLGLASPVLAPTAAPPENLSLLPLTSDAGGAAAFLAPQAYHFVVRPTQAGDLLRDVPLRGTLKQFIGRYPTQLPGVIEADLRHTTTTIPLAGTLRNGLGVPLYNAMLIWLERDDGGQNLSAEPWPVPRLRPRILPLRAGNQPALLPGAPALDLAEVYRAQILDANGPRYSADLLVAQLAWLRDLNPRIGTPDEASDSPAVRVREAWAAAGLLLSTAEAYRPRLQSNSDSLLDPRLLRPLTRDLDRMAHLGQNTALLVATTTAWSPGSLALDDRPLPAGADENLTVLRVLIPIAAPPAPLPPASAPAREE